MTETNRGGAATPGAPSTTLLSGGYQDVDTAPFGVKLLSTVVVVAAILDLSLSSLMLLNRSSPNLQSETGMGRTGLTAYAVAVGALGLVAFGIGIGLRTGTAWARLATILVAFVRLVGLGFAMIAFSNRQWYTAIVPAVIYVLVAYYLLYDREARDYFTGPTHP